MFHASNHSIRLGHSATAFFPVTGQMVTAWSRRLKGRGSESRSRFSSEKTARSTRAGPMEPVTLCVGWRSRLPIHTSTEWRWEKPSAQASRWWEEVPVFTAVCTGNRSRWPSPDSSRRASGSERMLAMRVLTASLKIRRDAPGGELSSKTMTTGV